MRFRYDQKIKSIESTIYNSWLQNYDFYEEFLTNFFKNSIVKLKNQGKENINFSTFINDLYEYSTNISIEMTLQE